MATDTANQAILDRLGEMVNFHPANAKLFDGWLLDPGDVVTVRADGTAYAVPVYQMKVDWKGESQVEITSTGSEKRPPLSELKRRNYGAGRTAAQVEEQEEQIADVIYKTDFTKTDEGIGMLASAVGVKIETDPTSPNYGKPVYNTQTGKWEFDQNGATLTGQLNVKADSVTAEVTQARGESNTLSGRLGVMAGQISLVVTGTGENAQINAASIVLEINKEGSGAYISADHIQIGSSGGARITLDDKVDVLGDLSIDRGILHVGGDIYANIAGSSTYHSIAGNIVVPSGYYATFNGSTSGYVRLSYENVSAMLTDYIANVELVEAGVLRLWHADGTYLDFSKAAGITINAPSAAIIGADSTSTQTNVTAVSGDGLITSSPAVLALTISSYTAESDNKNHKSVKVSLGGSLVAQINCDSLWNAGGRTGTIVTASERGSSHVGELTPNTYVCVQYEDATGTDTPLSTKTWHVPEGGGGTVTPLLNAEWGSGAQTGRLTVDSTPTASNPLEYWFSSGTESWNGNTATVPITTSTTQSGQAETRFSITVNGQPRYNAGWGAAYERVIPPATVTVDTASFVMKTPPSTVNGTAVDNTFTLHKSATPSDSGKAYVMLNGNRVGQISIGDYYTAGWNAVTVDSITGTELSYGTKTSGILLTATASNSETGNGTMSLTKELYSATSGGTANKPGVSLKLGSTVVGRADIDCTLSAGAATKKGSEWWDTDPDSPTYGQWVVQSSVTKTFAGGVTSSSDVTINIQSAVNAAAGEGRNTGWNLAVGKVDWPETKSGSSLSTSFNVYVPDATYDTNTHKTFSVSQRGSYAYVNDGSGDVARCLVSESGPASVESVTVTDISANNWTSGSMFTMTVKVKLDDGTESSFTIPIDTQWYASAHDSVTSRYCYKKIGEVSGALQLSANGHTASRVLSISAPEVSSVRWVTLSTTNVMVSYNRVTGSYDNQQNWRIS